MNTEIITLIDRGIALLGVQILLFRWLRQDIRALRSDMGATEARLTSRVDAIEDRLNGRLDALSSRCSGSAA